MKCQIMLGAAMILSANICQGKNILQSTDFEPNACGELGYWTIGKLDVEAKKLPGEGVNGRNALRLRFRNTEFFSHLGIISVPGGRYRIGGYVRTKDFSSPKGAGFMLTDPSACYWRLKTRVFPKNTNGKWVKIEKTVTLPKKRSNLCYFSVFAPQSTGTLDICEPFMIPQGEAEERDTAIQPPVLYTYRRIVPVMPVLNRIRAAAPEMSFTVYYPVNGKHLDYELKVSLGSRSGTFPLDMYHNVKAKLPSVKPGAYELKLALIRKSDGACVLENSYPCTAAAPLPSVPEKWLNNLVSELARFEVKGDMECGFTSPREGWIFLGLEKADRKAKVYLDHAETPVIIHRSGEKSETMRFLPAGKHHLRIAGISSANRLIVRTVKQLQLFPFNAYEKKDLTLFHYDLPFFRKYLWPAVNTQFQQYEYTLPEQHMKEARERGMRLINSGAAKWSDAAAVEKSVRTERDIDKFDGRALDELGYWHSFKNQLSVTDALFALADFDKSVYLWMAKTRGHLYYPMIHRPLLSAASNAGGGRGKMLMETYVASVRNEADVPGYMKLLNDHVRFAEKCIPDAKQRMAFMMSGYISAGAWNINIYPGTDIKYIMDYFFWKFANDPELKGIFAIGCYDINNCDEERVRWIGRLMRHYCVEGKTDLLSRKYGIVCNPGHLKDGDFEQGFDNWQSVPAEPGSLVPWYRKHYGPLKQLRQSEEGGLGDHAARFICSARAPNKLSQKLTGLVPGKKYSLCFVTADEEDIIKPMAKKPPVFFDAKISDSKIIPQLGYIFKKPADGSRRIRQRPQICNHKLVFIPDKAEVTVTFSDWSDGKMPAEGIGRKRVLNFVSVCPYFDGE